MGTAGEKKNGFFDNEVLNKIAKVHGKSVVQVILRWELQRDVIVIPKSTHKERMVENFNILDFKLTAKEMEEINKIEPTQVCSSHTTTLKWWNGLQKWWTRIIIN